MSEIDSGHGQENEELTASQMLSQERESLGLSQKDVADQLFLTTSFIRHIDAAEFDKIHKKAFIKGYLRSYARILKISGEEVVARYDQALKAQNAEQEVNKEEFRQQARPDGNSSVVRAGMYGFIALAIVIVVVWLLSDDEKTRLEDAELVSESGLPNVVNVDRDESEDISDTPLASSDDRPVTATPISDSSTDIENDSVAAITLPLGIETDTLQSATIKNEASADSAIESEKIRFFKDVVVERNREDDVQYIILRAGGKDELELIFGDECWLEIEDGDGAMIYSDLSQAGEVLKVYGIAPFDILFGKARAVSVQFNGEKVDLESRARVRSDDTARLRLGT